MSPVFADLPLARRIDGAEASLSMDIATAVIRRGFVPGAFAQPFDGGAAVFTGKDSPITKVIGIGFDGLPDDTDLSTLEQQYFAHHCPVRAEVASLADPAVVRLLTSRGYVLQGFENVLGRRLDAPLADRPSAPEGLVVSVSDDDAAWMNVVMDGFGAPDTGVVSAPGESFERAHMERIFDDMACASGFHRYLARVNGEPAAGSNLRLADRVAQLCGAATLPRFRRQGIQTAMLFTRLSDAAAAGCDIAVVTTEPGSKSQQNVQRAGFDLLYTRAVLVKAPPV
jgi:ribosomal protein S18 acetylase RimI-like enzyme